MSAGMWMYASRDPGAGAYLYMQVFRCQAYMHGMLRKRMGVLFVMSLDRQRDPPRARCGHVLSAGLCGHAECSKASCRAAPGLSSPPYCSPLHDPPNSRNSPGWSLN